MLKLCGLGVVLSLVAAAAAVMAAWLMDWWSPEGPRSGLRLFVPEELARYRGGPGDPGLYLALLGRVYDVSSGRRHYEPGAHYSGFAAPGNSGVHSAPTDLPLLPGCIQSLCDRRLF
ncbi:Cyb5d2 [Lemmus lemmus]